MSSQRMIGVVVLTICLVVPGVTLAQGPGHRGGMRSGMGPDSGSMMQMQGLMQQMGGTMQHVADRIQAGPMTPEQTKQMGEMMGQMADMMNKLSGMMGGRTMGPGGQARGMRDAETPQQLSGMRERLTQIQKQVSGMMVASPPAAPTAPQEK